MRSFLMKMIPLCCRGFECCAEVNNAQRDSLLWHKEIEQHALGDFSMAVVQANKQLEDQSQVRAGPHCTYIGVYDGHGGPEASRFITENLLDKIDKFAQQQGGMSSEVLVKAFGSTEEEFVRLVDKTWRANPQIAAVGSCCLVGAICWNKLYVANLGDSRAVMGTSVNTGIKAVRLSVEHNVGNEEVRQELKAQHPEDSHIVVLGQGVWRVKGIIQVSRSIGDVYLKRPELNFDPLFFTVGLSVPLKRPVLTADPSVCEYTLHPEDRFFIFASDGLWELLSDQEAAEIVHSNQRKGIAKRLIEAALREAAKKQEMKFSDLNKIERGYRRNFHDDITVVVVFLDHDLFNTSGQRISHRIVNAMMNAPIDVYTK